MATMGEGNPVELFNMHVAHVGINAKDPHEAQRIAKQFELLLGLTPRETPISFFSDDGSTFLIYLKDQIGGFAIHLSQGK